jgi:hypothetical protein
LGGAERQRQWCRIEGALLVLLGLQLLEGLERAQVDDRAGGVHFSDREPVGVAEEGALNLGVTGAGVELGILALPVVPVEELAGKRPHLDGQLRLEPRPAAFRVA